MNEKLGWIEPASIQMQEKILRGDPHPLKSVDRFSSHFPLLSERMGL
jgi:hypothetical protein